MAGVRMTVSNTGYMIDRALAFILDTTDTGDSWTRFAWNHPALFRRGGAIATASR